jgi:hypothetical protein
VCTAPWCDMTLAFRKMLRKLLSFPETRRPRGPEVAKKDPMRRHDPNSPGELRQKGSNDAREQKREQEIDEASPQSFLQAIRRPRPRSTQGRHAERLR